MQDYEAAKKLYEEIKEKAAKNPNDGFNEFYQDFLKAAADYAKTSTAFVYGPSGSYGG